MNAALLEALFGNSPEARKALNNAGDVMTDREIEGQAAMVSALAGDAAQAEKLAGDLNKTLSRGHLHSVRLSPGGSWHPGDSPGNMQGGFENLRTVSSHALMLPFNSGPPGMVPVYVGGEAYLAAHQGAGSRRGIPDDHRPPWRVF